MKRMMTLIVAASLAGAGAGCGSLTGQTTKSGAVKQEGTQGGTNNKAHSGNLRTP